eukprot:788615-Amphidinium_carterae.1
MFGGFWGVGVALELSHSEVTQGLWPFEFKLQYQVRLSKACLGVELTVMNTGSVLTAQQPKLPYEMWLPMCLEPKIVPPPPPPPPQKFPENKKIGELK